MEELGHGKENRSDTKHDSYTGGGKYGRLISKLEQGDAFTLFEMLLVVAIIAVLAAVSIPMTTGALERARVATDATNERTARTAAMAEYLTEGTFGEQPCGSDSVIAYYDAAKGKWVKDMSTIKPYGKCITTHGHADDLLEGIWNPSDGMVYLKWSNQNIGVSATNNSDEEMDMSSLQSDLLQPYNGGSRTAQPSGYALPGLCSVSDCSHTNKETLVWKNIERYNHSICKDCGQWIDKATTSSG